MYVERECIKCGMTYQIDEDDTYDICHNCYLQADKEYKQYVKIIRIYRNDSKEMLCLKKLFF